MGSNREVVEGAYAAFGRGDIPSIIGLLDENVSWNAPPTLPHGGEFHGTDGVVKFFEGIGAAWDPLEVDVEAVGEVGDDLVVGIVRGAGTLRGGSSANYGAVHVFTLENGRITRFREFVDSGALS